MAVPELEIYSSTDIGCVRPNNEDYFAVLVPYRFFFVADGMGGHNAGEVASREAIGHLTKLSTRFFHHVKMPLPPEQISSFLRYSIKNANSYVYNLSTTPQQLQLRGMGTTVCALSLWNPAILAHVGDSRIYHFDQKLTRLTQDHSLANKLFTSPKSNKNSLPHSYKGIITKALGTSHSIEPEIHIFPFQKGDLFLMCTDGLTDFIADDQIEMVLHETTSIKKCVRKLISLAKEKGGHDNITVLLIKIVSL